MSKRDLYSGPARIMKASEGIEPSISCLLDRRCNHLAMKPRPTKAEKMRLVLIELVRHAVRKELRSLYYYCSRVKKEMAIGDVFVRREDTCGTRPGPSLFTCVHGADEQSHRECGARKRDGLQTWIQRCHVIKLSGGCTDRIIIFKIDLIICRLGLKVEGCKWTKGVGWGFFKEWDRGDAKIARQQKRIGMQVGKKECGQCGGRTHDIRVISTTL